MSDSLAMVLVPGLNCSPRLYAEQIPALWRFGPVTVADHTRGHSIHEIACAILETAPSHFALAGLSLGGYIAFEIMRQAPHRVMKLALLDTLPSPETLQQTQGRLILIEIERRGALSKRPINCFRPSSIRIDVTMAPSNASSNSWPKKPDQSY